MKKLKYRIFKERIKQKLFGKSLNVRQSWEETPKDYRSMVEFLNWFDSTDSVQETIKRASSDWHFRFESFPYFSEIKKEIKTRARNRMNNLNTKLTVDST